ncbi:hypothetical protein Fmac_010992 [Flemingia macrophylla]|uniref:Glycine-rich protein n=1 Tax=Flemingia macrophylla TaxID=520843 RepID=A0ABD1ML60_9FABA
MEPFVIAIIAAVCTFMLFATLTILFRVEAFGSGGFRQNSHSHFDGGMMMGGDTAVSVGGAGMMGGIIVDPAVSVGGGEACGGGGGGGGACGGGDGGGGGCGGGYSGGDGGGGGSAS